MEKTDTCPDRKYIPMTETQKIVQKATFSHRIMKVTDHTSHATGTVLNAERD